MSKGTWIFAAAISYGFASALISSASAAPTCSRATISATGDKIADKAHAQASAQAAWLVKAKTIQPFALWETAKNRKVSCKLVEATWNQCTASGRPCGISSGGDKK